MENEIKVNEYARDDFGNLFVVIGKYERGQFGEICVQLGDFKTKEFAGEQWERDIKIGNLIDLIECGDYVNGYKVVNIVNEEPCPSGKFVDIDADRPSEYCTLWESDIETIVTHEQIEAIAYRVEGKD